MSLNAMAPPVEEIGPSAGEPLEALARGRHTYLTACAKCHNVEPIGRYSVSEWEKLLPEMAEESNLKPQQAEELRAYILAAHRTIEKNGQ